MDQLFNNIEIESLSQLISFLLRFQAIQEQNLNHLRLNTFIT